ncbi:MAG: ribbon-helix-helix domain-containing protein [Nanoarchaeota archaeon]|nr:ribbon-helix-helix domain-containing protein [Nanoarchaeota archaeon]
MSTQINIRMSSNLLENAKEYAENMGFANVQDFIREIVREKLFEEPRISKEEFALVSNLIKVSEDKKLYGTEDDLLNKLS